MRKTTKLSRNMVRENERVCVCAVCMEGKRLENLMASGLLCFPLVYCVCTLMESVCCEITGSNGMEGTSAVVV